MKRILIHTTLAAVMACGALSPAALAKTKRTKPSAEHIAAVKKCTEDYNAAVKAANAMRGNERKQAKVDARKARQSCVAGAPR